MPRSMVKVNRDVDAQVLIQASWRPLRSPSIIGPSRVNAMVRDHRGVALLCAVGACDRCIMGCEGAGEHICEAGSRPRGLLGFAGTRAATIVQTGHHLPGQGPSR